MSNPERVLPKGPRADARGAMLVELMIGLGIGALVLGAAIASLLVAREAASAVREMSQLQQQASHALRALGMQIRPAGSLDVQASPDSAGRFRFAMAAQDPDAAASIIQGKDGRPGASDSLHVARTAAGLLPSQREDCLGQKLEPGQRMEAGFDVDVKGALRCRSAGQVQPLVSGVSAFRLRYRVLQGNLVREMAASEVDAAGLWPAVIAIEVCLDLRGEERSSAFEARYATCTGQQASNGGRLHLVSRKLFAIRTRTGG